MRKLSITEALVELKLLDSRIIKAIRKNWIACIKRSEKGEKREAFEQEVKANYQAVMDLMGERKRIKSGIVMSNANTRLLVGGVEMTVAEAIERKSSISYEQDLLDRWKSLYETAINTEIRENKEVEKKLDKMLEALVGSDKEDIGTAQKTITENYMEMNGVEILDPLHLKELIDDLEDEIGNFVKNVDSALSMSNATTFIEV